KELSRNSFQTTTRIKLIDLSHNELTELEPEVFKDMQWLDFIDLSYNKLKRLKRGSFQRMFKVRKSQVLGHRLGPILTDLFAFFSCQIAINLSFNNLSSMEFKTFQELQN